MTEANDRIQAAAIREELLMIKKDISMVRRITSVEEKSEVQNEVFAEANGRYEAEWNKLEKRYVMN